jgi:hypothetical protein
MSYFSDQESGFGLSPNANNDPGTFSGIAQGFADLSGQLSGVPGTIGTTATGLMGSVAANALGLTGPVGFMAGRAFGGLADLLGLADFVDNALGLNSVTEAMGLNTQADIDAAAADVAAANAEAAEAASAEAAEAAAAAAANSMAESMGQDPAGNAPGADPSSSSSSGDSGAGAGPGSVICTALHARGMIPDHIIEGDLAHGRELMATDPAVMVGYWAWGCPLAKMIEKSRLAAILAWPLAAPWAYHVAGVKNPIGWVYMQIGVPVCRMIGNAKLRRGLAL